MADYNNDQYGSYEDNKHRPGWGGKPLTETSIGMQTSILKIKENKVTTIDFGFGPFKVEQFQELARLLKDFPPGAAVELDYGEYGEEISFQIKVTG